MLPVDRAAGPSRALKESCGKFPPGTRLVGSQDWGGGEGGEDRCLGVGGTPYRPCRAGFLDRCYHVTGAPFRTGRGKVADKVEVPSWSVLCIPRV